MTAPTLSPATRAALDAAGLDQALVLSRVLMALEEDLDYGPDVTTLATVAANQRMRAAFTARRSGVVAGLPVVMAVLDVVAGDTWELVNAVPDGTRAEAGQQLIVVDVPTRELLTAERTALNFLCHLSGVATLTRAWADALAGTGTEVRDTRKTTPGLRVLEKYAVRCGDGTNHRMGLGDAALVKDNHVAAAGGVREAVAAVRAHSPSAPLEVEVDSLDQLAEALAAGATLILLDNFTPDQAQEAVALVRAHGGGVRTEASGGLDLASGRAMAEAGVDYVAVGALTHSAPVLDIGLDALDVAG
jgi:nicotinate-nucleotide pyrophosphorylase (carboxylating)